MLPNIISNFLVVVGLLILIVALVPLYRLIKLLPPGRIRQNWYWQSALIILFIGGYVGYAITFRHESSLIVPAVFFFGAVFVLITINLSLQTALDIGRVVRLEEENITDPLIGIYNRRYMDKRLQEEFRRAKRFDLPLSVLLIDIDFFKQINDSCGHPVGDVVLRHWGGLILSAVRASDVVARYGGDEILVITPNARAEAALRLAERIRKSIEVHKFDLGSLTDPKKTLGFTVSIGVACLTVTMERCEELLSEADQALYCAKEGGRNRSVVSISLQEDCVMMEKQEDTNLPK
ncbi:MAG: hypothetical protein BGO78_05885 [Chloroflexi bacterium 44-23]|nr:MAG: hypothetical protein BGO78_05885 [Chloroflexi bacterium 44-23]